MNTIKLLIGRSTCRADCPSAYASVSQRADRPALKNKHISMRLDSAGCQLRLRRANSGNGQLNSGTVDTTHWESGTVAYWRIARL